MTQDHLVAEKIDLQKPKEKAQSHSNSFRTTNQMDSQRESTKTSMKENDAWVTRREVLSLIKLKPEKTDSVVHQRV